MEDVHDRVIRRGFGLKDGNNGDKKEPIPQRTKALVERAEELLRKVTGTQTVFTGAETVLLLTIGEKLDAIHTILKERLPEKPPVTGTGKAHG